MRISEIYGMDIYSDGGAHIGEVRDAIVDLEKGEVSRVLMDEWSSMDRDEVKRMLQHKSILFKNIKNIGDVVLVSITGQMIKAPESGAATAEVSDLASRR